jgi:hypothetical protein
MTLDGALEKGKTAYRKDADGTIWAYSSARPDELSKMTRGAQGTGSFQCVASNREELGKFTDWTDVRP